MYTVKEIFLTLQGEGANTGKRAVFVRFSGCNLWSGRNEDRPNGPGPCSAWCDTDFLGTDGSGGGVYAQASHLAAKCGEVWGPGRSSRFVVLTGGEPALQADFLLAETLKRFEFFVAIETNGTRRLPRFIDWVTVSPKPGTKLVVRSGSEIKVVYPQEGLDMDELSGLDFSYKYVQPMYGPNYEDSLASCVKFCMKHQEWRLSLQTHKLVGLA